ncbi:hypothetical protein SAMN05444169_7622 [Bradyrhizobium erythrophlei]|uniref:Uncharacterized protein n=1 Tax=Bradyrhizobium erythrophlei TaxID=1437360 RepID=A0A1M5T8Z2_9BRAD|nr:hypothetical protein SAMN05444169_7622 [Bradyrhizobium erythrophlei]
MDVHFIYTLDSHDCYGPFGSQDNAKTWAIRRGFKSYQILTHTPFQFTQVLRPY